jgi:hypothetical protein
MLKELPDASMKYWAFIGTLLVTGYTAGTCIADEAAPGGIATIRWVVSDTPAEDCAALSKSRKTLFTSRGCSNWSDREKVRECSIIAPMPRHEKDYERMATLGHEFWHCLYGNWHDDYGNAYPVALRKSQSHFKGEMANQ